jgi:hypothetical protein
MKIRLPESPRARWTILVALGVVAGAIWRSQLIAVDRTTDRPRPLVRRTDSVTTRFDATLPAVPVGLERLRSGDRAIILQYWAPWERHATRQIRSLDSLSRLVDPARIRIVVVCFDPFPSVARYVARQRIRTRVLLDRESGLRRALPCPSLPFTYVLERNGRIRVAQRGEVEWFAPETRRILDDLGSDIGPGTASAPGHS